MNDAKCPGMVVWRLETRFWIWVSRFKDGKAAACSLHGLKVGIASSTSCSIPYL